MNSIDSTQLGGPLNNGHLNDDQFTECLMGAEPGSAAAAHLSHCAACREELARFGMSVDSFNAATMAWSESRPSMNLEESTWDRLHRASWTNRPFVAATSWALAACLMLVAGVSIVQYREHRDGQANNIASVVPPQEDSEAQIAEDNQLLMEVDLALHDRSRSPMQEYGLRPMTSVRSRQRGEARKQ
jgi:hypothetical protein